MRARTLRAGLLAVAVGLVLGGCGDTKTIATGGGPPPEVGAGKADADASSGGPSTDASSETPGGSDELGREIVLQHDTSEPVSVTRDEQLLLRAKVIDYEAAGPASDVPVAYQIIDGPEQGDASLSTQQVLSNEQGEVGVTFLAGTTTDVTYTVRLNAPEASAVTLDVRVEPRPRGDLRVQLDYEGPIDLKNLEVRLYPSSVSCSSFNAVDLPPDPLGAKTVLGLGLSSSPVFEDLLASQTYTVVAVGESPEGSLAGAGCLDGIAVPGEGEQEVTLTMYLLTLNPTGVYDSASRFDFTGAIPGQVGELVDQVTTLFNDPGDFFIEQIKNLVANYVGELATDTVFGLFEDELTEVITNWMLNQSPDWLQDVFIVGQDLTQVVHDLELHATLKISKLQSDYSVQGVFEWDGIVLRWSCGCDGCPEEGAPGYDPSCAEYEFGLDDLQNTEFPLDLVEGQFLAQIQDFDRLNVQNHVIELNYGKLIIFALNEILLPAITGEDSIEDALASVVDCDSIAEGISDSILGDLGLSESNVKTFCQDSVSTIAAPATAILSELAVDSSLRLEGHARLVDDDADLIVERIIDGEFVGHIESNGQQGDEFDATWEAERQQ